MEHRRVQDYLALRYCPALGIAEFSRQLQECGSVSAMLALPQWLFLKDYLNHPDDDCRRHVDRELAWLSAADENHLLVYESRAYPESLRHIDRPPPVIAVRGDPALLQTAQIAIVGSRRCSVYGQQTATWIASELAACGLTITSGLALGIDAAAHHGALETGKTIAVLATGLDRTYPRQHQKLARTISEQGALISEFPLQTTPRPAYFPQRNRLISGLGLGVIVVEAGMKSGSLLTARLAMEQNRDVYAVPGQLGYSQSAGCHHLIRQGAKLLESAGDVLEELPGETIASLQLEQEALQSGRADQLFSASTRKCDTRNAAIMRLLAGGALPFETLLAHCDLSIDALHGRLLQLEIQGLIETRAGRVHARLKTGRNPCG